MKYNKILIILSAAAMIAGCAKEQSEQEKLDARVKDAKQLEVKYLRNGSEVQALAFSHNAVKAVVAVEINNPDLKWKLVSSRNWCVVSEDEHKGSDSVELLIAANDGFEARQPATLTFVAGAYRGATIQVTQSAGAFVISQPYFVSGKDGGSWTINVTTAEGSEWEIENGEWLTATKGSSVTNEGTTVTSVELVAAANAGESRFGSITLSAGLESDQIAVYQFGNDLAYKDDGTIFFDEGASSFSLIAPESMVLSATDSGFVSSSIVPQGNGTDLISFSLDANVSDINSPREVEIKLLLNVISATVVVLPAMEQNFTPSHGLNSAKGLKAFAQAIAEGGSTAAWEKDGVVTMIQDINMAGVTDWAGIGTAGHPFEGSFDGGGFSIKNLSATAPLFHDCKGASISNLGMDGLCTITLSGGSEVGAFAKTAKGTSFSDCTFSGKLILNGGTSPLKAGVFAGAADTACVFRNCLMEGEFTVNSGTVAEAYIGGIAGYCEGTLDECEVTGKLAVPGCPITAFIGGITSILELDTKVSANAFRGTVELSGTTGTNINLGGLYGLIPEGSRTFDYSAEKTVPAGEIKIAGFASSASGLLYAGGLVGKIDDGVALTVKGLTAQTNFDINHSNAPRSGNWFCVGGILGGCHHEDSAGSLLFENITNLGVFTTTYSTSVAVNIYHCCLGGIAGHVNGAATFSHCSNKAEIGKSADGANCGRSNGYSQAVGGIAGLCYGGNASFDNCENKANIANLHYNNNPALFVWKTSTNKQGFYDSSVDEPAFYTATATGGILGAFNYTCVPENIKLTVTSCSSEGKLEAIRGSVGGIVGFANNAEISGCTWRGSSVWTKKTTAGVPSDNQASDKGGIAGVLAKASVQNCTARGNMSAFRMGSAESANAGGIVAYAAIQGPVKVEGCAFYGVLTNGVVSTSTPGVFGGVLARNDLEGTTLKDNKFGGSLSDQTVTNDNLSSMTASFYDQPQSNMSAFFAKMKAVSASGTTLWNGN